MKIQINLKIFIFIIIFLFTGQLKIYGILIFFVFIHEIGHLIAGLIMGLKPCSLKIMPVGISIDFKVEPKEYNTKVLSGNLLKLKKIFIAMAVPATNIIIALLLLKININFEDKITYIYANILIAIFNLFPIYPLDGGRILKGIIGLKSGSIKSVQITNLVSNCCIVILTAISSIAIYYYKNVAILFIIIYLWILTIIENKKYNIKMNMYKIIENQKNIENK